MKKWMGISLAAVMIASSLTACSKKEAVPAAADKPSAKHDPVTLVFQNGYNSDNQDKFMADYGNKIMEKFPWITLEYSPSGDGGSILKNRVTSGGQIDVVFTSVGLTKSQFFEYNLQTDISGLITKNKFDLSRLEPTTVQMQRNFANGGIYGLPVSTDTLALFYNKDIFDKFGAAYPKDGMTWDDAYELAKKVSRTDGSNKYAGFGMSVIHMMRMNQRSLSYLDPKTNRPLFADDSFSKMVANFTRFAEIPGNEDPQFANLDHIVNKFIIDKKMAMLVTGSSTVTESKNAKAFQSMNWDMVGIPSFPDAMGVASQSYPLFFYVSATSKHKDDAFQAIAYLTSDEFQAYRAQSGVIPILKDNKKMLQSFGQQADQLKGKNLKALLPDKYAAPSPYDPYNSVAEGPLMQAIAQIVQGKKDINSALSGAVDQADKAIKAAQSK